MSYHLVDITGAGIQSTDIDLAKYITRAEGQAAYVNVRGGDNVYDNISMNNNRITNLATPMDKQDAANKLYVDSNKTNDASHLKAGTLDKDRLPEVLNSIKILQPSAVYFHEQEFIKHEEPSKLLIHSNKVKFSHGDNDLMILSDKEIDVKNHRIVNVVNPVAPQDVATKSYVDSNILSTAQMRYLDYKYILDYYKPNFWISGYYNAGLKLRSLESYTGNTLPLQVGVTDLTGHGLSITEKLVFTNKGNNRKIRLDGTNRITSSSTYLYYYTFIVIGSKDKDSSGRLFTSNKNNRLFGWWAKQKRTVFIDGNVYGVGDGHKIDNDGAEHIYILRNDNNYKDAWEDDLHFASTSQAGADEWGNVLIGTNTRFPSENAKGYVYEVICFGTALLNPSLKEIKSILKKYYEF